MSGPIGSSRDVEDHLDIRNQARSLLLVAEPGASVTVYGDTDFDTGDALSVIRANPMVLPVGVPVPIGIAYRDFLSRYHWDKNGGWFGLGNMDRQIQSFHWNAQEGDPTPIHTPPTIRPDRTRLPCRMRRHATPGGCKRGRAKWVVAVSPSGVDHAARATEDSSW
jgi:hypothetical protein